MLKTFTDSKGREWSPAVNVGRCRVVRDKLGVDLANFDQQTLARLGSDAFLLVDVLYLLVEPQAIERQVDPEEFAASLAGDALDTGVQALLENLCLFFPSRRRGPLTALLAKIRQAEDRLLAQASAKMDDPRIDQAIDRALAEQMTDLDRSLDAALSAATTGSESGKPPASSP